MAYLPVLHLACLLCYGALAAYILIKNPKALINRLCALVLACFMIWCVGKLVAHHPDTTRALAAFFRQIVIVGAWNFSPVLLLFSLALTDRADLLSRRWIWMAVFAVPFICIMLQWHDERLLDYVQRPFGWGLAWKDGPWTDLLLGYTFFAILLSTYLVFAFSLRTPDTNRKVQCRLIAICILLGAVFGFGTNLLAPQFGLQIPDLAQNLGLFWTAGLVFAIVKYGFMVLDPASAADKILSTMSDPLILADPEGRIVTVNPAGLRMLKAHRSELIGNHIEVLFPSGGKNPFHASQIMTGAQMQDQDGMIRTLKSGWVPVSLSVSAIFGDNGQSRGVIVIARDITERIKIQDKLKASRQILEERVNARTAELSQINRQLTTEVEGRMAAAAALRQSEEKYRNLVENVNDAVFICQGDAIRYANPKAIELTGYSEAGLLKTPFNALIHTDDRTAAIDRDVRRFNGEAVPSTTSFRIVHRSGAILWVQANSVYSKWDGQPAVYSVIRDITQQKKMENMLNHMQRLEAVGTMAGGIAHDFNNILCPILGYAEMLAEDLKGNRKHCSAAEEIVLAAKRARDLIRQILSFSRQKEQELKPIDILPIVREVISLSRATIPRTIEIQDHLDPVCGQVMADPTQIHQVVMNLITNAHRAMVERGGRLFIALTPVDQVDFDDSGQCSYVRLTVEDTGTGMDEGMVKRIFDPYYTTREEGCGLGLPVALGIVNNLQGTIEVNSLPGKGSRFDVYLPVSQQDEAPAAVALSKDCRSAHSEETILVVEDEDQVRRLIEKILSRNGYRVDAYADPVKALEAFQTNALDYGLVITDMAMPNMTGEALARELLHLSPGLPIVLCTGYSEALPPEAAKALGIQSYMLKPIESAKLLETVHGAMEASV